MNKKKEIDQLNNVLKEKVDTIIELKNANKKIKQEKDDRIFIKICMELFKI